MCFHNFFHLQIRLKCHQSNEAFVRKITFVESYNLVLTVGDVQKHNSVIRLSLHQNLHRTPTEAV